MANIGADTLAELHGLAKAPGQIAIWWLGQAGFAIRGGGTTVLVDPFLADAHGRAVPTPLAAEAATGVEAILCTHEHVDHLDGLSVPALAAASPEARFLVPTPIVSQVVDFGVDSSRVVGVQPGAPVELGGLTIHALPARHGVEMADAYTFGQDLSGGLYRYLGFVLDAGGVRVYHAGDTILYDGMEQKVKDMRADVAMLPINGRDGMREAAGLIGNLNEREAAWLAAEAGAGLLIPMHYEMFERNRGYPSKVLEAIDQEGWKVDVLVPGKERPFVYTRA